MSSPHPIPYQKPGVSPPTTPNQAVVKPAVLRESLPIQDEEYEAQEIAADPWFISEEEREELWAGKIMVDSTRQFTWIVYLKEGIGVCFAKRHDIFVAGDLAWFPDANEPRVKLVPDAMVVIGRPPHDRNSYKQWEEENVPPQVVFEVISLSNSAAEMQKKRRLYEKYGVEEFYLYDPLRYQLSGYVKGTNETLDPIENMEGWKSPQLGITFRLEENGLRMYAPDNKPILSMQESEDARLDAEEAQRLAEEAQRQAEAEKEAERLARQQAEAEKEAERLARQQAEAEKEAERLARQQAEAEKEAERLARQQAEAEKEAERQVRQQAESQLVQLQQELDALRKKAKRKKTTDSS